MVKYGDIIEYSDAILIDRGDLSREISIPSVPIAVNLDYSFKGEKPLYDKCSRQHDEFFITLKGRNI